jgi:curli biogenesis system outer membrane secretion channel CsgG
MKKLSGVMVIGFLLLTLVPAFAKEKPRMGVLRFTNQTHVGWWTSGMGQDMQDMLINELASMDSFRVLERKELDAVIKEQDLGASGRIRKSTRSKIGNITGAKYLVAATVSAYEESTKGTGGGISFSGISLGGKQEKAYMAVDLKVIDVGTGEIADHRTVEANSSGGGLGIGLNFSGFSGNLGGFEKTPAGKAIRACVMEIAEYLDCSLNEGKKAPCMDDYNAKEQTRRKKTKSSISLE